jgi:hypothetical protein
VNCVTLSGAKNSLNNLMVSINKSRYPEDKRKEFGPAQQLDFSAFFADDKFKYFAEAIISLKTIELYSAANVTHFLGAEY